MNVFTQWLAPEVLRALGLALSHFLWQGAAMAALAAGGMALARQASSRYLMALAALVAMVAAPVITFAILYRPAVPDAPFILSTGVPAATLRTAVTPGHTAMQQTSPFSANTLDWLVAVWFAGVFIFSLRTAGGFLLIARLRRRDSNPVRGELLA